MSALPRSPAPVAPEHVTRLLHAMDEDFDELITDADLTAFVARHGLAHLFPDELLASMFAEANATGDGFLDAEQLGKAVSRKFPNRKHNDDWHRLFDLAPRPPNAARITELSPRPPEQEPIRANFEQEPQILTFSPLTNPRVGTGTRSPCGATGGAFAGTLPPRGAPFTSSAASLSSTGGGGGALSATGGSSPRTRTFNAPPLAPPPAAFATAAAESSINRRMQPDAAAAAPAPAPVPGVDVASFEGVDAEGRGGGALRCTFDACAAFDRVTEALARDSRGAGWQTCGAAAARAAHGAGPPPPLYYGVHGRDWRLIPGGRADHIPLRTEGVICRVTGEPATTPLRLQATENSRHGLANSMRHAVGEWGGGASGEFTCVFGKADAQTIKRVAAQDRLEAAKGTEPPPMIAYLCGKPSAHDFRPPLDPSRMPEGEGTAAFKTSTLGRHWPVREGMIVSDLRQANPPLSCPPLRVALTENTHPAARSTRAALKS